MTRAELELVAKEMRARGLHSSWDNLLEFSRGVVGNLADAYQALLRNSMLPGSTPFSNPNDAQKIAKDKLAKALTLLTSEAQVTRWESEVLARNNMNSRQEAEDPRVGGQSV